MKKWTSMMLFMLFVLTLGMAQAGEPVFILSGRVVEMKEDGSFLMEGALGEEILVKVDENTISEMENPLACDQFVGVTYNGAMTFSLPAQIYAMGIQEIAIESGEITEIAEEYLVIEGENGLVRVNLDEASLVEEELAVGERVTVLCAQMATRSLPPQVYGYAVVREE